MYRYAQIDENGYIVSDSHLSGEVTVDNMIPVSDDFDLSNKRYVDGEWQTYEPSYVEELSEAEQAIFETGINTEYLVALAELG